MKFLITGVAGFIGSHVTKKLINSGHEVVGIDNLNDYCDINLKYARLNFIKGPKFTFYKLDLIDRQKIRRLFFNEKFDKVIHLAAQAGVRYSLKNPHVYAKTNIVGYLNILEACYRNKIKHLLYASSSSVYGANNKLPFSITDSSDHPISLYAATKKSNELMSYTYSHIYGLPTTGLRFFTVYGPWSRPDMALFKFTKKIITGNAINVYNYGKMKRDFTYIDDVVEVIIRLQDIIPQSNVNLTMESISSQLVIDKTPYCIYNVGNSLSITLEDYINILEEALGIKAKKVMVPIQPGDIIETIADTESLCKKIGFKPKTSIKDGVKKFVNWYKDFYNI